MAQIAIPTNSNTSPEEMQYPQGGQKSHPPDANLSSVHPFADIITWMEDQLESCGIRLADTRIGGAKTAEHQASCVRRLIVLSIAGRQDSLVASLLTAIEFDQVCELVLRSLRSDFLIEASGFSPIPRSSSLGQLSFDYPLHKALTGEAVAEIEKQQQRIKPEAEIPRKPPVLAPGQKQLELFGWQELSRDWKAS